LVFKYTWFLVDNVHKVFQGTGLQVLADPCIHLPIGISFFAFQGISYALDISRGQVKAARNLITFGAYKSFFPQLIAGPIVRYKDVAADFNARRDTSSADIAAGTRRFAVGLAKKVLVANTLAVPADAVFGCPAAELSSAMVWYGAACYALQIYFDFSGYSDMAIGLGRIFGIHILENFRYPYMAVSIRDFWQRWHISLSTWFRDYLYVPLGGSRCGKLRTTLNLWTVFLLCGLWHGAEWTFVAWGAWYGVFLSVEHMVYGGKDTPAGPVARIAWHAYTLLVVLIGWILFRAVDLEQAMDLIAVMFGAKDGGTEGPLWLDLTNGQNLTAFVVGAIGCSNVGQRIALRLSNGARNAAAVTSFWASTVVLASEAFNPFIYFRF
jgi:alginate O-acetyltransferase complex protein AlgI